MSWALSLQNAHTFFFGLRRTGFAIAQCSWEWLCSRRGARRRRRGRSPGGGARPPRVVGGRRGAPAPATAGAAAGAAAVAAAPATEAAFGAAADAVDLGRGVLERRADLIDLELDDGALLALTRLVRTLLEPAGHHHPHAAGERLGHVLGRLAPHVAAHEQRLAVLPLAGLAVEVAGRGGDGEVGDRGPRRGEPQLGIGGEVCDHGDEGHACNGGGSALRPRRARASARAAAAWCAARTR